MTIKGRGLVWLGLGLTALVVVTVVPIVHFYQGYWTRLESLPQMVVSREQRHKGQWVRLSRVSLWVPRALIATEDRTFSSNLGVSFEGIVRSLLVDLHTHQFTQGGSTLTQQLARDMLLTPVKKFRRKVSEALLALMITALYSKRQILAMYLNEVYLGAGAYGVKAASQVYFGLAPQQLSLPQAALVAGLPQAPSADDPLRHFARAKQRQFEVLVSMVQDNMISQRTARQAYRAPLALRPVNNRSTPR